jgi:3-dehydroquinate dehydratase/shikimate dehydrogenase
VDAATKVYGVAGDPIRSSLSPLMMNTAFRRETVNAVYLALQTGKADDLFRLAREIPIQGLSITMPLKEQVIPLLARTDALSTKIGSVNTISRMADGKFYGFNTDVAGIIGPLERRLSLKGARVLVLGAGGAARAAVFGCRDKGAEVFILNRTPETAQKLARQAGAKAIKREAVAKTAFDVIINATPVGMAGNSAAPLLEPEDLNARIVFDLVYNPLETALLRQARQKGLTVISGVEMFVQQGARQFEIWTGKPAPEEEMLRVVLHALRQAAEAAGETPAGKVAPGATVPNSSSDGARSDASLTRQASHADPEPSVTASPKPSAAGTESPAANQVKPPTKTTASTSARPAPLPAKGVSGKAAAPVAAAGHKPAAKSAKSAAPAKKTASRKK